MNPFLAIGAVAGGAAVGAPTRYLTDRFIQARHDQLFPWGTFTVNVVGSLILGTLTGLGIAHGLDHAWILIFGTGFCGGLTTFSTFGYEDLRLAEEGAFEIVGWNIIASVATCLLAAATGLYLTGALT